jgi:hypothetical protein
VVLSELIFALSVCVSLHLPLMLTLAPVTSYCR